METFFTQDMELQAKAIKLGQEYVKDFWEGTDLEKKAWLANAAAFGFIQGFRAAQGLKVHTTKEERPNE